VLPPACASCGAPLPATAVDTANPDLCPTCAARNAHTTVASRMSSVPGPPPPPVGSRGAAPGLRRALVVKARPLDGLLTGIAAAVIGGTAWWAVTSLTALQIPYLAIVVGLLVGQGVLIGARKGGIVQGIAAAVLCVLALAVAEYFIQRSLAIHDAHKAGSAIALPLWQGFSFARHVVTDAVKGRALTAIFWGIGAVVAFAVTFDTKRRPVVG
jgi:hypothetical protein